MSSEFKTILDEKGSPVPGLLKNKFGMIIASDVSAIQKYKNEKSRAEQEAKERRDLKNRLSEVESSLSEIKSMLYLLIKKDDK